MHTKENRRVPSLEQLSTHGAISNLNWENIRIFISVARLLSFRASEKELGMSLNTIRRRIDSLEAETGSLLFTRHVSGLSLTPEGKRLSASAQHMEIASFNVKRTAEASLKEISGQVRVSITEGIGTFWVIPQLVDFQRTYPNLIMDIQCTMKCADILQMDSDISIQLERPGNPDLIVVRLGHIHLMPFAAQNYLEIYGHPKSIEDAINHKFVLQVSNQNDSSIISKLFPDTPAEGLLVFKTNTSSSHYWAVTKGAGIGMIPTYIWAIGGQITPINVGFHITKDIWLVYHPDARKIKRIAITIDRLKQMFDGNKYPWFRDEFIAPNDLSKMVDLKKQSFLFEGFTGR